MCIAILSPKGTQITAQQFRNCWDNNYNGAGFMYNDDNNKLHVVKEMEKFERIYNKYVKLRKKYPNATFVLHFRISTHGVIDKSNCHPFKVNNELGFVHNGIIREVSKSKEYSDTNMFNREILRKLPYIDIDIINNPAMNKILGEFIDYSKLVFMDNTGKYALVNESKGTWEEDGIWYSNDSHKRVKNTVDYGGKTMTREELKKLQGDKGTGKVYGGSESRIGYDYPAKYYDEDSDDYLGGASCYTDDDFQSRYDKATSGTNSRVGNSYGVHDGGTYLVSDGTICCDSCGVHTLTGELMSEDKECLGCLSEDDAAQICTDAVRDGAIIQDCGGTFITDLEKASENSRVECSYCSLEVNKKYTTEVVDWELTLCKKCTKEFVDAECIHEDGSVVNHNATAEA